ncbi:hypothetical protein B9Z55_015682 [Caenorhabditis nigoni]|uniref:Uncharacterized protein n=1 Tax=Caenorhabditis nigoni TaxID=1611254 RepID=A0A2G5UBX3_9PELO|nr:hypothetical protein B9Z55_015682 [Caenorhabditis nigoni]
MVHRPEPPMLHLEPGAHNEGETGSGAIGNAGGGSRNELGVLKKSVVKFEELKSDTSCSEMIYGKAHLDSFESSSNAESENLNFKSFGAKPNFQN